MPITVTCPSCHRTFRVGDHVAGRRGLCPDCNAVVSVPELETDQLDSLPDEDDVESRPAPRRSPHRPSPRDHLPAWRRVSVGFLIQQLSALVLLLGLGLLVTARILLADDPGDLNAEPTTPQMVTAGVGAFALLIGFVGQAVGRIVSASTPVRAPRALGVLSAVASVIQVLGFCLIGGLVIVVTIEAEQGNAPNPGVEAMGGLCVLGWMFLVVGGESLHGFAVAGVAKVLRADGARMLGNGLGVMVAIAGLVALFFFCGLAMWVGQNNPQNPEPDQEQTTALLIWMVGIGIAIGFYWFLDLVLLQRGRSAVAQIGPDVDDRSEPSDRWD